MDNKQKKSFIILVEMLEREPPTATLLGTELAGRSHNIWLMETRRFHKSPASFAQGLPTVERYRAVRRAGHLITVMRQEGFTCRPGEDHRAPPPWAKLLNKVSRERFPKKMQKRYIELDEVNRLLRSLVSCNVRDRFVPADGGRKLQ